MDRQVDPLGLARISSGVDDQMMAQAERYMKNVTGADLARIIEIAQPAYAGTGIPENVDDVARSIGSLLDGISDQRQTRAYVSAKLVATLLADMVAHLERDAWEEEVNAICSGRSLEVMFEERG